MAREGRHYKFRKLEFWAESGLINIIDHRHSDKDLRFHKVLLVSSFLENLRAMSAELKKVNFKYADERNEYVTLLENSVKSAREAKNQGRPDDPHAVADMIRARRKTQVVGNGSSAVLHTTAAEGTPEGTKLPPLPVASSKQHRQFPDPSKRLITFGGL